MARAGEQERGIARDPAGRAPLAGPSAGLAWILAGLAVLLLLAAGAVLALPLTRGLTEGRIEALLDGMGPWAAAVSIGLLVLHSFVPFPAELVALANGMCFGAVWGTLVTWTGAMLGALFAFFLARRLGRPFVGRILPPRHLERLERATAHVGWRTLLVVRLLPLIAFNLINWGAGLTPVGWLTFAWTTALGILPVTLLMTVMGDQMGHLPWRISLAALALLCALFAASYAWRRLLRRRAGKRLPPPRLSALL